MNVQSPTYVVHPELYVKIYLVVTDVYTNLVHTVSREQGMDNAKVRWEGS
jgi:hypothetical protein